MDFQKNDIIDLSIIITTHQRPEILLNLIMSINNSKVPSKEIIIVGTAESDFSKLPKNLSFIKIISKVKNQIYQRNLGIKKARGKYLLQVDDDIIFDKKAINIMLQNIVNSNDKTIFSINLLNSYGQEANVRWTKIYNSKITFRIILYMLNGFKKIQPASIILSGRPIPNYLSVGDKNYEKNQWLNSCIILKKSSLKDYKNYYISGKSFYEDVITTHNFYLSNYKLIVLKNAKAYHPITSPMNFITHLKTLKSQFLIVKIFKKSYFLFLLDIIIFSFIFLFYNFYKYK